VDGDKSNSILKFALIGGAGYLLYVYLQNSGLWSQWFGGGNSFTNASQLLSYCQSNPSGTASFNGQSAACSAWLQAAASQTTTAAPASPVQTPAVTPKPSLRVTPLTVTQLLNAVEQNGYPANANATFTNDQWNWFVTTSIDPNAVVSEDLTPYGYKTGAQLTAAQYIALRQQAGVSGLGFLAEFRNPYNWVN
jgi:hypothetical protein